MSRDLFNREFGISNLQLKTDRIVFELSILGNATANSKTFSVDAPATVIPRLKGTTMVTAADAVETLTWTDPVDATNAIFGILIKGANIAHGGSIKKVKKASVTQLLATGSAIVVTANNALQVYVTPNNNIAIEITATGTDLSSSAVHPTFCCEIIFEVL